MGITGLIGVDMSVRDNLTGIDGPLLNFNTFVCNIYVKEPQVNYPMI